MNFLQQHNVVRFIEARRTAIIRSDARKGSGGNIKHYARYLGGGSSWHTICGKLIDFAAEGFDRPLCIKCSVYTEAIEQAVMDGEIEWGEV